MKKPATIKYVSTLVYIKVILLSDGNEKYRPEIHTLESCFAPDPIEILLRKHFHDELLWTG
jgi:hypothetical protein